MTQIDGFQRDATCERHPRYGVYSIWDREMLQGNTSGEGMVAYVTYSHRDYDLLEGFASIEQMLVDGCDTISEMYGTKVPTTRESGLTQTFQSVRKDDGRQGRTVMEGHVPYRPQGGRQGDLLQTVASVEGEIGDDLDTLRNYQELHALTAEGGIVNPFDTYAVARAVGDNGRYRQGRWIALATYDHRIAVVVDNELEIHASSPLMD